MLYEEFEKLNCQHIKLLEQQNTPIRNVLNINDSIPTSYCMDTSREDNLIREQFNVNKSCIKRTSNNSPLDLCNGFDCSTQEFYQLPDRLNTFHNYLVLEDEKPILCTKNHQYYNNWTRRKVPMFNKEVQGDDGFLDKYFEPLPRLKLNRCDIDDTRYFC